MNLKDILYRVSITATLGEMDREVKDISFNSKRVSKGCLFVAVSGLKHDGHQYIDDAVQSGAEVVICEKIPKTTDEDVTYVAVKSTPKALGILAANYYDNPSQKLKLIGITGTNGKTTTATLLYNLYMELGYHCGLISTVINKIAGREVPASYTTPDALALNALLAEMVQEGISHCFMEVSSHALEQSRVEGVTFAGAVFTNISHDHLDYHGSFENYIKAKKKLFDQLPAAAFAISNTDDRRGSIMLQNTKAEKLTYALKSVADIKGRMLANTLEGIELEIAGKEVWFKLIGGFNSYNLLAVYSVAVQMGEESDDVLTALSMSDGVSGRFERVGSSSGILGIVDYSHTPDALDNALKTIEEVRTKNEQLITIVGCGGNRDKAKRPIMGDIACKYSDKVIFTSDNPRDEDAQAIIEEMESGLDPVSMRKVLKIVDREEAIKTGCMLAKAGDIILVAGKGHETYQEIKGVKYPFDDREVLGRMLNMFSN